MREAIAVAREGIHAQAGGPFGTVIVKDGVIIARAHNSVLRQHDATAHGEIAAIREAGKKLGTHDLSGCDLYTTGEPCSMCLCATLWANIRRVYYGCTIGDNARIGFRDGQFDRLFGGREQLSGYLIPLGREECLTLFEEYARMPERKNY
ncbi:MAG: nucleoside deaminase [Bacteroidales bacterium]|nr:nucleoside deaminase [Bacteroidales bacterium]